MTAVKLTRTKALILGIATILVAGLAAAVAYLTVGSDKELHYETQRQLRNGLPSAATAELQRRGITLEGGLTCQDVPGWNKEKMRASCTGRTADNKSVQVLGSGEEATRKQWYTILVDGGPVVQNARCLGTDCRRKD
ncbi:hypothetical protein [Actinomadura macrotermitis]|uniref:hypothetical protein n=1 Tax=Actinomadura macrotermitis TaxID=2585200 RepID=UPI002E25A6F8